MFFLEDNQSIFSLLIVFLAWFFMLSIDFQWFLNHCYFNISFDFFFNFPYKNQDGINLLNPQTILSGFSNTSLITVISL